MKQTLLEQGLDLLVYGMGAVFVFLTLLVLCTYIMSFVMGRFFPEQPEVAPAPTPAPAAHAPPVDRTTLAVIQAAIHKHRAKLKTR